jgi:flagellin
MTTQTTSQTAITTVNVAISSLATVRAGIGATISQLTQAEEFTANNLISAQSALGEIVDADIASASSNLSALSVLVQAAMSMLAQANKQPEVALTLLR